MGNQSLNHLKKPINRRQALALFGGGTLLVGATALEGFYREIVDVSVSKVSLPLRGFQGKYRLALISDLHYTKNSHFPRNSLAKKIHSLKPDAVAVTGDCISNLDGLSKLREFFEELPRPCYVTAGNWEHYLKWALADQRKFYRDLGVDFLDNQCRLAPFGSGVNMIGVDDPFSGRDDLKKAIGEADPEKPGILLAHAPLIGRQAKSFDQIELICCGHTHGGQIRLPLIGPIAIPPGSNGYDMGMFDIGGMKLYVNRGIGSGLIPFRFLCPPEITIFDFHSA